MSYIQRIQFFLKSYKGMRADEICSIGRHNAQVEAFFVALTGYELGHKAAVHPDAPADLDYYLCKGFKFQTIFLPAMRKNPVAQRALVDILSLKLIHAVQGNPKFQYRDVLSQRHHLIRTGRADAANDHFGSTEWPDYLGHILSQLPCGWRHHMTLPILRAYWHQAYYDCELAKMLDGMKGGSTPDLAMFDYLTLEARYRQELFPVDLPKTGGDSNGVAALLAA